MSLPSRILLSSSIAGTIATIVYVHYKQKVDKERMHEGVVLDIERQRRRKAENLYLLQQQIDLTKEMKRARDAETVGVT